MQSSSPDLLTKLIYLKVVALLHDVPHKLWLIAKYGLNFGTKYKDIVTNFSKSIVSGSVLDALTSNDIVKHVDFISRVASTPEEWIFRIASWPSNNYVYYERLHNIFDPRIYTELSRVEIEEIEKRVSEIISELNNIVKDVEKRLKERGFSERDVIVFVYNILYLLLEALWYVKGLPSSPTDTRAPTCTVFDHLYASATLSNLFLFWEQTRRPQGFLVLVDFPGIIKFVNSGRKAGDFWASSWLLSNVMWGVAEEFASIYGFDVILIPTSRLNPYAMRYIIAHLMGISEFEASCRDCNDPLVSRICGILRYVLGIEPEEIWIQPLIPATIKLLIPPIDKDGSTVLDEDAIKNKVLTSYRRRWEAILDYVASSLENATKRGDKACEYIYRKLTSLRDILSTPCQGVRVYIIKVEDVYNYVVKCLEGDYEACELIGLRVTDKKLKEVLCKLSEHAQEELALMLTWHVLMSRGVELVKKKVVGRAYEAAPRAFWTYAVDENGQETLKPISSSIVYRPSTEGQETWIPCTLCGIEPAVLRLSKSFRDEQLDYSDEDKKEIAETIGIDRTKEENVLNQVLSYLKVVLKPGEALGPYCLFKRAIYLAFKDRLGIVSTDDVALERISSSFSKFPDLRSTLFEAVKVFTDYYKRYAEHKKTDVSEKEKKNIEDLVKTILSYIYTHGICERLKFKLSIKDINMCAEALSLEYEEFTKMLNESLKQACMNAVDELKKNFVSKLVEFVYWDNGLPRDDKNLIMLKHIVAESINGRKLCDYIWLPTSIAIIRGDADNMGELLLGRSVLVIDEYVSSLLSSIARYASFIGDRSKIMSTLYERFTMLKELLKSLGLEYGINTPSRFFALSLSLILSAIEDYKVTKEYDALLVYTGGDDIYVLSPVETALSIVFKSRKVFFSNGFRRINGIPVTSAPVTGRSYSVRFVNILDPLNEESTKTFELLEEKAKKCIWYVKATERFETVCKKDSLVISDSRAGVQVILPLREVFTEKIVNTIRLLLALGALSSSLPEDLENLKFREATDTGALERLIAYGIERNITIRGRDRGQAARELLRILLNFMFDSVRGMYCECECETRSLAEELVLLIRILRRYL